MLFLSGGNPFRVRVYTLGSLSKHDVDGNENVI